MMKSISEKHPITDNRVISLLGQCETDTSFYVQKLHPYANEAIIYANIIY